MTCICPNCKGKKFVFNPECLFLTVMVPLAFLIEHNQQEEGLTKKICSLCKGKGVVKYEA